MAQPNPSPRRRVALAWHRLVGWACFRICAWERSRAHYERVLEITGEDFDALVRLGRVAYKLGDYAAWKRECGRARRVDPQRYGRLKHPFELFEPRPSVATDGSDSVGDVEALELRSGKFRTEPGAGVDDRTGFDGLRGLGRRQTSGCDGSPDVVAGDDFCSAAERDRFRELSPIEPHAVAEVDLDDLARRLIG